MKRLIPAFLCVITALAISTGSYAYIKTQTEKLCGAMDGVLESGDAFAQAIKLCEEWKSVRVTFGALLKHSDADELGKYFILIDDYAASGQKEELLEAVEGCRTAIKVILEGEKPGVANIF